MLLRLAYLALTNTFTLMCLLPMRDQDKDIEILALRHQLARGQAGCGGRGPGCDFDDVGPVLADWPGTGMPHDTTKTPSKAVAPMWDRHRSLARYDPGGDGDSLTGRDRERLGRS